MPELPPRAGLVSPSKADSWLGGHYVVQSLFLATQTLPPDLRPRIRDVWWNEAPASDPFAEVRELLGLPAVIGMPHTILGRATRALTRRLSRSEGAADLFRAAGIDVLYPVRPFKDAGVPFVFFLPDLQYRHLTHVNDERTVRWFEEYFRAEGAAAAKIHLTSESVLRDVETFLPSLASKCRVVFPVSVPTAGWYAVDPGEVRKTYALPERYFVISNQVSAHKNHRTIALALRTLLDRGIDATVVCTGRTADYRDETFFPRLSSEIDALGLASRFRFLGVVPRTDQLAIIRGALAVLQPSEFEGWGAAVAEANSLGKPLLASDLPVHHEHEHPVVTYVATHDVDGWSDAMARAWSSLPAGPDLAAEEAAHTRTAAKAYSVGVQFSALLSEAAAQAR
ncbi:MAG TPA: glycosyltransferase [Thermoanaerobaculia bacterium]|nr:glycosyltransferase [Thermoanaerobaculia bacterium]